MTGGIAKVDEVVKRRVARKALTEKVASRERRDLPLTQKRMHVLFSARRPRTLQ